MQTFKLWVTSLRFGKVKNTNLVFGALIITAIALGIFFRSYNLGFPQKEVFDEVYFPKFAQQYIQGIDVYDVHPPLGKFVIALGILGLGETFIAWRIMPLLFGIAAIFLLGFIAWKITKSKLVALLAALFVAVDGIFIIYSRTGLMDGILLVAIFAALLCAIQLKPKSSGVAAGIFLGFAIAIKWPAAAIFFPMLWYAWRAKKIKELLWGLPWALAVYFVVVYAGEVLDGSKIPFQDALNWNKSAFTYHADITATHPWGSAWWTWPIPLKPVLFLYDTLPNNTVQMMTSLGNPLLWISSSIAVAATVILGVIAFVKQRFELFKHPLTTLVIGYFAFWLPWALVDRVVFLYHYFPSYAFALLILCYWLGQIWKVNRIVIYLYVVAVLVVSFYYLPWAVGWIPVSLERIQDMVLIKSWLY